MVKHGCGCWDIHCMYIIYVYVNITYICIYIYTCIYFISILYLYYICIHIITYMHIDIHIYTIFVYFHRQATPRKNRQLRVFRWECQPLAYLQFEMDVDVKLKRPAETFTKTSVLVVTKTEHRKDTFFLVARNHQKWATYFENSWFEPRWRTTGSQPAPPKHIFQLT